MLVILASSHKIILFSLLFSSNQNHILFCGSKVPILPQSYGNGPNITFPFYIRERQPEYCGYPGFHIFCGINNYPILYLTNNHYIIRKIFYNNESLRVSDPTFLSSNSINCFPRAENLKVYGKRFGLAPNQTDLFLLFGCVSKSLPQSLNNYRIGFSREDNSIETGSVLGFHGNGSDLMEAIGSNKCENGMVKAKVEDTKDGVLGALRRGFLLKWRVTKCSLCEKSLIGICTVFSVTVLIGLNLGIVVQVSVSTFFNVILVQAQLLFACGPPQSQKRANKAHNGPGSKLDLADNILILGNYDPIILLIDSLSDFPVPLTEMPAPNAFVS